MSEVSFQTSRAAYLWCVENKLVSKRIAEVLDVMTEEGAPMNQTMVHQAIIRKTKNVALEKYSVSPRFAVLERMGLIRESGRQICPVSRRSTVFFEVVCAAPMMTEAEAMNAAKRRETMATLKRENAELRKENESLRELLQQRSAAYQAREERIRTAPVLHQTSMAF